MSGIWSELLGVVGERRLLPQAAIAERATSHWNSRPMQAAALAMPETTAEIASILAACDRSRQSVITQGGLTNCVAAAEPDLNDIVLSTEKMAGIVDIDTVGGTVTAEAGTVLQVLQEAVAAEGYRFPLDLGARGSCTIGGNIATNAGGINVLRYGMVRNLVLGLESVLADGTVVSSMNRMLKNNAGYDTKQIFIGTEGTLGIVSRAVLRIFPAPAGRQDALLAFDGFANVLELLNRVRSGLAGTLSAFEVMWGSYYDAVTTAGGQRAPLSREHAFYVLLQAEGAEPETDAARFENLLAAALQSGVIADAIIPKSDTETRQIWNLREEFDALLEPSPCYLYDVSLPIRAMESYVEEVSRRVSSAWPDGCCYSFGHMADGNLHFFVLPHAEGDFHELSNRCVYEPLAAAGGSVSAEHGIGTEKLGWLPKSRSAEDIALMRKLKSTLDPNNILNPGRVLI